SKDACAILHWAHLLSKTPDYYASIVQAGRKFADCDEDSLPVHKLFLCVVAHFTDSSRKAQSRKWPGMGFTLGSEFLRNLHWNGFKPDRHIKRLLNLWTNGQVNVQGALQELQQVTRRNDRELEDNLKWSLIGMEITPKNDKKNFSQFDNLIWLLGAYIEK